MFAGPIDSRKRLLMEKTFQPMLARNPFQCLHNDLIVIDRDICLCIDGRQLMLCRSDLIMLCLRCNADLPQLLIDVFHERRDPLADRPEIVVVKLLSLRRHGSEKSAARVDQILSLFEFLCVHKKILLLRAHRRRYFLGCSVSKQSQKPDRLFVDRFH